MGPIKNHVLFIHTRHHGVPRRIDIPADDVLDRVHKQRIIRQNEDFTETARQEILVD